MKDSVWYNKLWQNKMLELPLEGDESAAWQKMQALLDGHLPVESPVAISKPAKYAVPVIIAIVAIIAAVLLYFAVTYVPAKHNKTNYRHNILPYQPEQMRTDGNKDRLGNTTSGSKKGSNIVLKHPTSATNGSSRNSETARNSLKISNHILNSISSANNRNNGHDAASAKNRSTIKKGGAALKQYHADINPAGDGRKSIRNSGHRFSVSNNQAGYGKAGSSVLAARNLSSSNPERNSRVQNQGNTVTTNQAGNNNPSQKGLNGAADSVSALLTGAGIEHSAVTAQNINNPGLGKGVDSAAEISKTVNSGVAITLSNAKEKAASLTTKSKAASSKKTGGNSKFELGVKIGVNSNGSFTASNQNNNFYWKAPVDAFLGISAAYYFSAKVGLGVGLNVLSPKSISGSYSKDSLAYTTTNDTGKIFKHNTGRVIIHSSRKVYSVDIPVFVSYKANSNISFMAGPVIGIPVKQGNNKNSLSLLTNSSDTTASKEIGPYVNSTTINNKVNFSFSGGLRLNFNRLFIDGTYMQNITPYTISSGLGSGKVYYRTFQFGIGFQLFKRKNK